MARKNYAFDEKLTQAYLLQGRGRGHGAEYLPWLTIRDLPSLGRCHRVRGIWTTRVHHLLSDGEWKCFLKFESDPAVMDIREQFPMDRFKTMEAALELGYAHPITTSGTPYVMTSDFLVTFRTSDGVRFQPYTFKYDFAVLTTREQQLIEIAERFWQKAGYELKRLDLSFLDDTLVKHYDTVRSCFSITNLHFYRDTNVHAVASALRDWIVSGPDMRMIDVCELIAGRFDTTKQTVFYVAKHLIARRIVLTDFSDPTDLSLRTRLQFRLNTRQLEGIAS